MGENYISENQFADALIRFVSNNPNLQLETALEEEKSAVRIPDSWVSIGDPGVYPAPWDAFESQYRSPEADIIERIFNETQGKRIVGWNPDGVERDPLPITGDFWFNRNQQMNYELVMASLREKGMLTKPTRFYADDKGTVGLKVGNKVIDLPGSYRNLDTLVHSMEQDYDIISPDIPRKVQKYNCVAPIAYIIGKTVEIEDERPRSIRSLPSLSHYLAHGDFRVISRKVEEMMYPLKRILTKSPNQKLYGLIQKQNYLNPKYQSIFYVLAEKKKDVVVPRMIGHMKAFVQQSYGVRDKSISSEVISEGAYTVPQPDLTAEEMNSVDCSQINWREHQKYMAMGHLGIEAGKK